MNALLLDGSRLDDDATAAVGDLLVEKLEAAGLAVWRTVARDLEVAPCRGCFRCWVDTPGVCCIEDDGRDVTRGIATSDLVVLLSPITFGGYSPELKRLLDRSIGVLLPFFKTIDGETHHRFRYPAAARLLVVGVQAQADEGAAALFRSLATRNGVNLHAPAFAAGVISADQEYAVHESVVCGLLTEVGVGGTGGGRAARVLPEAVVTDEQLLGTALGAVGVGEKPRKALLLVGSPKRRRSTSAALGGYLMRGLEEAGVSTSTLFVGDVVAPGGASRLEAALDGTDLLVLAFPLYVDALPAPLVLALEHVAAVVARSGRRPLAGRSLGEQRVPRSAAEHLRARGLPTLRGGVRARVGGWAGLGRWWGARRERSVSRRRDGPERAPFARLGRRSARGRRRSSGGGRAGDGQAHHACVPLPHDR